MNEIECKRAEIQKQIADTSIQGKGSRADYESLKDELMKCYELQMDILNNKK